MALLGLTSAQAKFAKWLIRAAENAIPAAVAWLADDLLANPEAAPELEWRRVVTQWVKATPTGTVEDIATFKFDVVNVTADELDVTWTTTDYGNVMTPLGVFRSAIVPYVNPAYSYQGTKIYRMRFNPVADPAKPFLDTGAPAYATSGTLVPGTQTGSLPYQVAQSVTLRTAWPKHWGRVYLPTPGSAAFDSYGRLTSTQRSGIAGAVKTLLGSWHDAGFYPVIPVTQVEKQVFHGLLDVTEIVADDVPDVIRRRRPKQVGARTIA